MFACDDSPRFLAHQSIASPREIRCKSVTSTYPILIFLTVNCSVYFFRESPPEAQPKKHTQNDTTGNLALPLITWFLLLICGIVYLPHIFLSDGQGPGGGDARTKGFFFAVALWFYPAAFVIYIFGPESQENNTVKNNDSVV